jgi:hypothetical protein
MQLDKRFSRTDLIKPVVVGEIGYEQHLGMHFEDFQRMGFWLAALNGAAGYTYGAAATFEADNPEKPLHRIQYTFQTWQEGMALPGSYQVGLSAKLLQQYPWWQFAPHPEWVTPRGTTLLEPHAGREFNPDNFDFGLLADADGTPTDEFLTAPETTVPGGEWKARRGTFRRPYAAGIPGKLRMIYTAGFPVPPTVLDLEPGVRYQAYYWEPTLGIKFDLGAVEIPKPGAIELQESFDGADPTEWSEHGRSKAHRQNGTLVADGETMSIIDRLKMRDGVLAVGARGASSAGVLMRYQDADNYVAAVYSAQDKLLYWITRIKGVNSDKLGATPISSLGENVRLSAEARLNWGAASITDGKQTYSTPIVTIAGPSIGLSAAPDPNQLAPGAVGLWHPEGGPVQRFDHFEVRQSPAIPPDEHLARKLYDARGMYRGELSGPVWGEWGRDKAILLTAYRPESFPSTQDWVLVLDARP